MRVCFGEDRVGRRSDSNIGSRAFPASTSMAKIKQTEPVRRFVNRTDAFGRLHLSHGVVQIRS